jgi:NAD(P)H-flavin reductase
VPLVTARIADVTAATPRSRLLTVDLGGQGLDFAAGQAVMMGAHGSDERRPYSIACSPERAVERGRLEFLIGVEADGDLGASLLPAAPGMLMDVEGPIGTFTYPPAPEQNWLLFVAGGTGIAPLRAMLDHALRQRQAPRLSLLYSARRSDEFAFVDELRAHADAGVLELHQTVTREDRESWAGGRGRIARAHFETVLHEPSDTLCFVCGPTALVNESISTLRTLGVPEEQIRTEQWGKKRLFRYHL